MVSWRLCLQKGKKKKSNSLLPFAKAWDLPVPHNCMMGCKGITLIEINPLFVPLNILFIAQIISKICLTLRLYNLGKRDGGGNTVVKMQKVFKLILYYNKLFTLMIQSFMTTHWGERRRQEPLSGLAKPQPNGPQASAVDHQGHKTQREGL